MTPYHHYPRVSLSQCRCANCANTLRDRILDRLWEKKAIRYTPPPAYVMRRKHPPLFGRPTRRARANPPAYKQRRLEQERMNKVLESFKTTTFVEV